VGSSFLVRGTTAFRGDSTLRLRIHRRESTRRFPDGPAIARFCVAVVQSFARSFIDSAHSASLVQPVALGVSLVCHYPSPAAIFELMIPATRGHRVSGRTVRSEAGISRVF
jgi:hypothetical protein